MFEREVAIMKEFDHVSAARVLGFVFVFVFRFYWRACRVCVGWGVPMLRNRGRMLSSGGVRCSRRVGAG